MSHFKLLPFSLVLALGCTTVTEQPNTGGADMSDPSDEGAAPTFLDLNGNTLYDAVDRNLDSNADFVFAESAVINSLVDAGICLDPALLFMDANGDGSIDAIDLNCDGIPDIVIQLPDGSDAPPQDPGTGQDEPPKDPTTPPDDQPLPLGETCNVIIAIDGDQRRVECSEDPMGTTCACYRNDALVDSCSPVAGQDACSVTNGCCDFGI